MAPQLKRGAYKVDSPHPGGSSDLATMEHHQALRDLVTMATETGADLCRMVQIGTALYSLAQTGTAFCSLVQAGAAVYCFATEAVTRSFYPTARGANPKLVDVLAAKGRIRPPPDRQGGTVCLCMHRAPSLQAHPLLPHVVGGSTHYYVRDWLGMLRQISIDSDDLGFQRSGPQGIHCNGHQLSKNAY